MYPFPVKTMSRDLLLKERVVIAFVGVNQPGYKTVANAYLREAVKADSRLPEVWAQTIDFDVEQDTWWMLYQLLALNPVPDIISFSIYCWNAEQIFELSQLYAQIHPEVELIAGGPEVGPRACEVLGDNPQFSAIIEGEGEKSVPSVVLSYARGGAYFGIPGVAAHTEQGIRKVPAEPLTMLDTLASPYNEAHPPALDGAAYLETFRGCPHQCAYCFEAKGSTRIRSFSWERVAKDVERMAQTPGLRSFTFIDSVFNLTLARLEKLAEILEPYAQRGISLHTIEVDIESIDKHQAELLKRCGVRSVETGPQTTNVRALKLCKRSFDKDAYLKGVAACKDEGIVVEADLIIGLPGDSVEDVLASFEFAVHCGADKVQMSTLHVLPGTPLWEQSEDLGLVFDKRAPHEIVQTHDISFRELCQLEVFGVALSKLYNARLEGGTR